MPLYDYKCNKCQTIFDVLLKLKDIDKEMNCPECDSKDVVKLISKNIHTKWNCGGFSQGYATNTKGEQR